MKLAVLFPIFIRYIPDIRQDRFFFQKAANSNLSRQCNFPCMKGPRSELSMTGQDLGAKVEAIGS